MLKGIDPVLSPELLKALCEMGHGDEILMADANYPAVPSAKKNGSLVIRADGIGIPRLLRAMMELFPLDTFSEYNVTLMKSKEGEPSIWKEYEEILSKSGEKFRIRKLERFDFYEHASKAYAIIATGERALYANILLKKGVLT